MDRCPQNEPAGEVVLRLFVTGGSQRSLRAIEAVQRICKEFLSNSVRVEVVDVIKEPEKAESEKILATPTLIRQVPGPPRRLVGDLGQPARVIELLGLQDHTRRRNAT
ncbi:MAG TPA: circadian clock KaiB family protein [Bryobacteraceae bacterium]|nr:circadian clock KaiB family protein [Bryobacteraceae bacterium]